MSKLSTLLANRTEVGRAEQDPAAQDGALRILQGVFPGIAAAELVPKGQTPVSRFVQVFGRAGTAEGLNRVRLPFEKRFSQDEISKRLADFLSKQLPERHPGITPHQVQTFLDRIDAHLVNDKLTERLARGDEAKRDNRAVKSPMGKAAGAPLPKGQKPANLGKNDRLEGDQVPGNRQREIATERSRRNSVKTALFDARKSEAERTRMKPVRGFKSQYAARRAGVAAALEHHAPDYRRDDSFGVEEGQHVEPPALESVGNDLADSAEE